MTFLLDTHILLWALADPERLSSHQRSTVEDPTNTVLVSAISITEIVIKESLGKLSVDGDILAAAKEAGFDLIHYKPEEAMVLAGLPYHHKDPFDRMLIAQGIHNSYPIMTNDGSFSTYGCNLV